MIKFHYFVLWAKQSCPQIKVGLLIAIVD